jgi:hypothetical protein
MDSNIKMHMISVYSTYSHCSMEYIWLALVSVPTTYTTNKTQHVIVAPRNWF